MKRHTTNQRRKRSAAAQKKSARGKLLKSACAGLLGIGLGSGAAGAFEVNEATSPLVTGGDFNDDFPGEVLPPGVTSILGKVGFPIEPEGFDIADYFQLTGLQPGTQLGLVTNVDNQYFFNVLDSAGNFLSGTSMEPSGEVAVEVPSDGIIIGWAAPGEGGIANTYAIEINANYVPEPGTGALAALGAAALLGLGKRKRD